MIKNTDGPTFVDDQGSEIPESAEFYNFIAKTFFSKNSTANSIRDDATTIFASSAMDNDTTWSEDDAITIFISPLVSNGTTWSEDAAITIFTSPINNDTTWRKEDTTITIYNASDKSLSLLNNHQNISEKL